MMTTATKWFAGIGTLLVLLSGSIAGQSHGFDVSMIEFHGHTGSWSKDSVIATFGPTPMTKVNYECGGFSEEWQGEPFFHLPYQDFTFIGNDTRGYILQQVSFDPEGTNTIRYNGIDLNGRTTISEFSAIMGAPAREHFEKHPESEVLILMDAPSDDGARFTFRKGKLLRYEFWSPC